MATSDESLGNRPPPWVEKYRNLNNRTYQRTDSTRPDYLSMDAFLTQDLQRRIHLDGQGEFQMKRENYNEYMSEASRVVQQYKYCRDRTYQSSDPSKGDYMSLEDFNILIYGKPTIDASPIQTNTPEGWYYMKPDNFISYKEQLALVAQSSDPSGKFFMEPLQPVGFQRYQVESDRINKKMVLDKKIVALDKESVALYNKIVAVATVLVLLIIAAVVLVVLYSKGVIRQTDAFRASHHADRRHAWRFAHA